MANSRNLRAVPTGMDQEQVPEGAPADTSWLPVQNTPEPSEAAAASESAPPQAPDPDPIELPVKASPLQSVYQGAVAMDPERAAKVLKYSQQSGQPAAFVDQNFDSFEKAAKAPTPADFTHIENNFKGTAQYLSKPEAMAVAHDDVPNLTQHEGLIGAVKDAFAFEKRAFQSGALQEELAFLRYNQMETGQAQVSPDAYRIGAYTASDLSSDPDLRAAQIHQKLAEFEGQAPHGSGLLKRGIYGATQFVPQILGGLSYGAKYAVPSAAGALAAGAAAAPITGGVSMAIATPAAEAAMAAGMTVGETEYNYKLMTGLAYDQLLNVRDTNGQPLPRDVIRPVAMTVGAATAGLSLIKLNAILGSFPAGKAFMEKLTTGVSEKVLADPATYKSAIVNFAKNYASAVAQGTGAMTTITGIGIAGERAAEAISGQTVDHSQEPSIPSQLGSAALDAALTFGVLGAPGPAVGLHREAYLARKADLAKQFVLELGKASEESKLRQRLPEEHRAFIEQLTKDGPVETAYIEAKPLTEYFQSKGIDPDKAMEELGVKASYDEAKLTGGDVKMPLADFAQKLAPTEYFHDISNFVKFDSEDMNARQKAERDTEIARQVKQASDAQAQPGSAEAFAATAKRDEELRLSGRKVYDAVFQQLKQSGLSTGEAKYDAKIHEHVFRTMGERQGLDPYELYQRYDLSTRAEKPPESGVPPAEGQTFFQDSGDKRGSISFGDTRTLIKLFTGKADKSTFLHESGHFFLEVMRHSSGMIEGLKEHTDAHKALLADSKAILDWLGVKSWNEVETHHHEKWARAFEQYLGEGKAPSVELRSAFRRFKEWLSSVYSNLSEKLKSGLNDEIRGVMDRMVATQAEIDHARRTAGFTEFEGKELPPALAEKVNDLQRRARQAAEETLLKEQMGELKKSHRDLIAKEREKLTRQAEKFVRDLPVFKAESEVIRRAGRKSTGPELAKEFLDNKSWIEGTGNLGKLEYKHATAFELAAEVHGFADGQDLAKSIIDAHEKGLFESQVKTLVDDGMKPFADMMKTDVLRDKAMETIHTQRFTELLGLETQILSNLVKDSEIKAEVSRRSRIQAKAEAAAARRYASEAINAKRPKEAADVRGYVAGEKNAAVRAARAAARGDFAEAAKAKREQMINHALASEAMKVRAELAKIDRYLAPFVGRGPDLMGMPYGTIRQIDGLLAGSWLSSGRHEDLTTLSNIAATMAKEGSNPTDIANATGLVPGQKGAFIPESLADFVKRTNDTYMNVVLPDSVMSGVKPRDQMSLGELRDLKEAVQVIAQSGRKFERFLGEYKTMDVRQAAVRFLKSITENFGTPYAAEALPGSRHATKLGEILAELAKIPGAFDRNLDTMYTTTHKFDGLKEGPAKEHIYRPFEDAVREETTRKEKVKRELDALFAKHYNVKELAEYKRNRIKTGENEYFTKEEFLCMALNWGNETNRDRLMTGLKFSRDKMMQLFEHLEKKDWDFAQATWNHLNQYWPDIVKLEMEVNGIEPKKVESNSFINSHGEYAGGYYPIAYDFGSSVEAFKSQQERDALYKQFSVARAHTDKGHTEARLAHVDRPLRLSLDVLNQHHEDVIHDLSFRRAVIDVSRFLNQKEVKIGIRDAVGVKGYAAILDWVKDAAGGGGEPMTGIDQVARKFRLATVFYNMAYRTKKALLIGFENVQNVSSELGMAGAARAIKNYYKDRTGMHALVVEKSPMMKERMNHLDREISDITKKYQGTADGGLRRYAFFVHGFLDQAISFPLWADVYKRAIAEHGDEKLAVNQADEAVKATFMTGSSIDQPLFMRGAERYKALTTAYGYQSMMYNRFSRQRFAASRAWAQGNTFDAAAIAARSTVYTFFMPALAATLSREYMRNSKNQSKEERKKRMIATFAEEATPLKFIPVIRDLNSFAINEIAGEPDSGFQATPLEGAARTLLQPFLEEGHHLFSGKPLNKKFPEHAVNAVSFSLGVPKEFNDITFNYIDWINHHGELTWRDAISRRTKK